VRGLTAELWMALEQQSVHQFIQTEKVDYPERFIFIGLSQLTLALYHLNMT
jgi:hypothetical protein